MVVRKFWRRKIKDFGLEMSQILPLPIEFCRRPFTTVNYRPSVWSQCNSDNCFIVIIYPHSVAVHAITF